MKHPQEAQRCYRLCRKGEWRIQGQLRSAVIHRRSGSHHEAAAIWQRMIDAREGGVQPYIELAKYCEHRLGDYETALSLTEKAMLLLAEPKLIADPHEDAVKASLQKRYSRLRKKINRH